MSHEFPRHPLGPEVNPSKVMCWGGLVGNSGLPRPADLYPRADDCGAHVECAENLAIRSAGQIVSEAEVHRRYGAEGWR